MNHLHLRPRMAAKGMVLVRSLTCGICAGGGGCCCMKALQQVILLPLCQPIML